MPPDPTQPAAPTTAEAAADVRAVVPQAVIQEAAKLPVLQAGQINDRTMGGLIGAFIAYGVTHVPGHEIDLTDTGILALGAAAATLGTQIGAKIPEHYRPWLTSIGTILAILFGVSAAAPS